MEPAFSETPDTELTLKSVDERIKQATDPILERVEELCALLASRTEMESAGNSEASGSRRERGLSSSSRNFQPKFLFRPGMIMARSCHGSHVFPTRVILRNEEGNITRWTKKRR